MRESSLILLVSINQPGIVKQTHVFAGRSFSAALFNNKLRPVRVGSCVSSTFFHVWWTLKTVITRVHHAAIHHAAQLWGCASFVSWRSKEDEQQS
jgi:hypothetical protein